MYDNSYGCVSYICYANKVLSDNIDDLKDANDDAILSITKKMEQAGPDGVSIIEESEIKAIGNYHVLDLVENWDDLGHFNFDALDDHLRNVADSDLIKAPFASAKFKVKGYKDEVYKGSDINYLVLGMNFAQIDSNNSGGYRTYAFGRLGLAGAVLQYNAKQATEGVDTAHNRRQGETSGQYWAKIGFDMRKNYKE